MKEIKISEIRNEPGETNKVQKRHKPEINAPKRQSSQKTRSLKSENTEQNHFSFEYQIVSEAYRKYLEEGKKKNDARTHQKNDKNKTTQKLNANKKKVRKEKVQNVKSENHNDGLEKSIKRLNALIDNVAHTIASKLKKKRRSIKYLFHKLVNRDDDDNDNDDLLEEIVEDPEIEKKLDEIDDLVTDIDDIYDVDFSDYVEEKLEEYLPDDF